MTAEAFCGAPALLPAQRDRLRRLQTAGDLQHELLELFQIGEIEALRGVLHIQSDRPACGIDIQYKVVGDDDRIGPRRIGKLNVEGVGAEIYYEISILLAGRVTART